MECVDRTLKEVFIKAEKRPGFQVGRFRIRNEFKKKRIPV